MALGREDAVPEISTQRRLTKSCWLQGDEAGTAGKRRNFAPLLATTTTTPSTPHAPSPKPLCGRERCRVCRRRKVLLLLLLGRDLFVPCRVEEATVLERVASPFSFRKRTPCLGALIVAVLTWHPAMMDLSPGSKSNENIAATPSGAPVLEGGSETEIVWQNFRPIRGSTDKRRADSFGAGSREETVRQRRIGSCWPLLAMAPISSRLLRTKTRSHFRSTGPGFADEMRWYTDDRFLLLERR
jgi:hypothetical protein